MLALGFGTVIEKLEHCRRSSLSPGSSFVSRSGCNIQRAAQVGGGGSEMIARIPATLSTITQSEVFPLHESTSNARPPPRESERERERERELWPCASFVLEFVSPESERFEQSCDDSTAPLPLPLPLPWPPPRTIGC